MKKLFSLLSIFAIVLSCSSDETSTPVSPPPAPVAKYTITLSAGEGGTVSTTGGEYEAGQTVSVTATPQGEYVFTSWSDGNTNATRTITISSNSTLTANFEKRKYPLTVNFEGEGEVLEEIVNAGRTTDYDSGTTVKLTAQAAAEWVFIGWTGDIESTEESVQIVIGEPKEVTATFEKKKYPLSVNIEGEGEVIEEIIEASRTTDHDSGTTVKLTAQPADEWLFTGWSGDIGDIDPTENPIQLNIIESKTVTATFEKKKYPLTVNIEGEGEVLEEIVNAGRTTDYDSGTTVKLTAVPAEGWEFVGWTGDIESEELEVQLLVGESKTVSATFSYTPPFVSKAPIYSSINQTVDKIIENYYYPGEVLGTQEMFEKFDIKEGCNQFGSCTTNYELNGVSMLYFDFNNDDKLDLFGFLQNNSNGWVSGRGKFIVVEDVLSENYKVNYYDSNNFFAVRPYLNDFNQDGKLDILLSNEDRHDNQNGGWYKPEQTPLQILYFDDNGSFTIQEIGSPTTTHDLVTGDIDNDGDIDIVNFEWVYRKFINGSWDREGISIPLFYINQGNGVFEVKTENFLQGNIFKNLDRWDYIATNVELFDINNDGCLDIIHAYNNQGSIEEIDGEDSIIYIQVNGKRIYFDRDFIILYGNCSGNYDLTNSDVYNFQSPSGVNSKAGYFGCSFLDLDNDGDYDIISNEIYENGVGLRVLINNNGAFNIDDSIISPNVFLWSQGSQWDSNEFPPFGQTKLYDADDDGDFDIFPYGINGMEIKSISVKGKVYWENQGGRFILRGF